MNFEKQIQSKALAKSKWDEGTVSQVKGEREPFFYQKADSLTNKTRSKHLS